MSTGSSEEFLEVGSVEGMRDSDFWSLISLIDGDGKCDSTSDLSQLIDKLSKSDDNVIFAFEETLATKLHALDTRRHYRTFSWLPGLSDSFLYKRLSVVGRGEAFYNLVLAKPRKFPWRSTKWLESLLYAGRAAFEMKHGTSLEYRSSVSFESFSNVAGWEK